MVEEIKAMRERADIDGYLPQGMNEKEIRQIGNISGVAIDALPKSEIQSYNRMILSGTVPVKDVE